LPAAPTTPSSPAPGPDGNIYIAVMSGNRIARFDTKAKTLRVINLPSKNTGIRKASVDADGRYWYMGSHNGKLGVIE